LRRTLRADGRCITDCPSIGTIVFNEQTNEGGATVFRLACRLRFERIVSKRLAAPYLSDRIGAASRDGAARCREGRPGHDETTSSFFLVSTEIAGCPAANAAFT
jgi:hypothetical protein